jgi:hypothetical protein
MSPRHLRVVLVAIGLAGIAGIIVGSIVNSTAVALTARVISAIDMLFLIALTSVVGREAFDPAGGARTEMDDEIAKDVEARIERLASAGADEDALRKLVTRAIELGKSASRSSAER